MQPASIILVFIALVIAVIGLTLLDPHGSPEKLLMRYAQQAIDQHKSNWFGEEDNILRCYKTSTGEFVLEFLNRNYRLPFSKYCKAQCDSFVIDPETREVHRFRIVLTANAQGAMPLVIGATGQPLLPFIAHDKYVNKAALDEWAQRAFKALNAKK